MKDIDISQIGKIIEENHRFASSYYSANEQINEEISLKLDAEGKEKKEPIALEDLQKIFDPEPLAAEIATRLGIKKVPGLKIIFAQEILKSRYGDTTKSGVTIQSDNLIDLTGIMKATFKAIYVQHFNRDFDKEKNVAWLTVCLAWEHRDGGTNGSTFLTAWFDFNTKKWTFRGIRE